MPVLTSGNGPYLVKEASWVASGVAGCRVGLPGSAGWSRVVGKGQWIYQLRVLTATSLLFYSSPSLQSERDAHLGWLSPGETAVGKTMLPFP